VMEELAIGLTEWVRRALLDQVRSGAP
jgi:hypothetical protein